MSPSSSDPNEEQPRSSPLPLEHLEGTVEHVIYQAQETGFTVARLSVPGRYDPITIVGCFPAIHVGQTLHLAGYYQEHPRFGRQFQVASAQAIQPATLSGLEHYLGSGFIPGIGPVIAKRIVAQFGLETLGILEHSIERLAEVPGIGQQRIAQIQAAWQTQKALQDGMLFLQSHGISHTNAVKICQRYGDRTVEVVSQNPYQLIQDIAGIGFLTADAIARRLGIAPDAPARYQAGLLHVLRQAGGDGHCFLPESELVERAATQLTLPDHPVNAHRLGELLMDLSATKQLVIEQGYGAWADQCLCYAPAFSYAERMLAEHLSTFLARLVEIDLPAVERWIERYTHHMRTTLSPAQRQAVLLAASSRLLLLTGGPGCGKTFTTTTIVALFHAMGKTVRLAAPTGRAAQRLAELTGEEATTIHRLLGFEPQTGRFRHTDRNPLEAETIVVDEASMLDLFLAHALFKAIPPHAQVLLVGDMDQLPSVGPGRVLRDLIASEQIPVVKLTEVFRQAAASQIVINAHRINAGQMPVLRPLAQAEGSDCLWLSAAEPAEGVTAIHRLVTEILPAHGIDPVKSVQVLCPGTRGEIGTRQLNTVLQQALNPAHSGKAELLRGDHLLRVGDRVIQQINDYPREVFNGELGTIRVIDQEEQEVIVQFAERMVSYDFADLSELALAWAVTVHKSQGSEYPVVVLPLFMQHAGLLTRNLLYTGLTLARQLAILVGSAKTIGFAVHQVREQQRYTALAERLRSMANSDSLRGGR
ncbi:MAG TPA: ATP-dependent RecD-like DNA helicase [Ktedonobacteraceae bacterium]|nr:ATP-dependent RecD-like DNA helicase [Ktedonobacteraceae bacterium]